jgi:hypothetical protein
VTVIHELSRAKGPWGQTPTGRGLRQPVSATQTESPAEENGEEAPKLREQSQNVIENKGPAAEAVAA